MVMYPENLMELAILRSLMYWIIEFEPVKKSLYTLWINELYLPTGS